MVDIYETPLHFRAFASGFNWRWGIFVGIWGGNLVVWGKLAIFVN